MAYTEILKKASNAITLETKNGGGVCGEVINYGTQKAREYEARARQFVAYNIEDCYVKGGSEFKKQADRQLQQLCKDCGGYGYRITSACTMQFSAAWFVEAKNIDEAGDTWQEWAIYETKNGTKCIPLEHDDRKGGARSRRYVYYTKQHTDKEENQEERKYFFDEDERNTSGDLWGEIEADYLASVFPL